LGALAAAGGAPRTLGVTLFEAGREPLAVEVPFDGFGGFAGASEAGRVRALGGGGP
jgi:hypothetical protein